MEISNNDDISKHDGDAKKVGKVGRWRAYNNDKAPEKVDTFDSK